MATLSEPEAAAIHYASQARVETGAVIAVYDLGGGTFDAAVLRKTDAGWETLGSPEGIERLGGVDFDAAVFHHVVQAVDGAIDQLDPTDPAASAAVARLRQECVEAKEALSSDTDVSIPVLLPNLQTEVRLTRSEYEQMVRPALADSITATNRALRSAGVAPDDVTAVLLVGGSSRTPLVAELVGTALGRPVAVDAHPKHGVALGASILAAQRGNAPAAGGTVAPTSAAPAGPAIALATAAAVMPPPGPAPAAPPPPAGGEPSGAPPAPGDVRGERTPPRAAERPPARASFPAPSSPPPRSGGDGGPPPPEPEPGARSRRPLVMAAAALLVLVAGVGAVAALGGPDDDPEGGGSPTTTEAPGTTAAPTTTTLPEGPFVQIDEVVLDGGTYRANYRVVGYEPDVEDPEALHVHFFLDTTAPENAGENGEPQGVWELTDETATYLTQFGPGNKGDATRLCSAVATFDHDVHLRGTPTGNCVALPA